jgi:hypothetical protein
MLYETQTGSQQCQCEGPNLATPPTRRSSIPSPTSQQCPREGPDLATSAHRLSSHRRRREGPNLATNARGRACPAERPDRAHPEHRAPHPPARTWPSMRMVCCPTSTHHHTPRAPPTGRLLPGAAYQAPPTGNHLPMSPHATRHTAGRETSSSRPSPHQHPSGRAPPPTTCSERVRGWKLFRAASATPPAPRAPAAPSSTRETLFADPGCRVPRAARPHQNLPLPCPEGLARHAR